MELHKWETISYFTIDDERTQWIAERRMAVPGGWLYQVRESPNERLCPPVKVDDPTAPHCQPTPPADDRPPMTTGELDAWLREHHGPPPGDTSVPTWLVRGKRLERFEDVWCYRGTIVPARDIGVMVWADRRWPSGDASP